MRRISIVALAGTVTACSVLYDLESLAERDAGGVDASVDAPPSKEDAADACADAFFCCNFEDDAAPLCSLGLIPKFGDAAVLGPGASSPSALVVHIPGDVDAGGQNGTNGTHGRIALTTPTGVRRAILSQDVLIEAAGSAPAKLGSLGWSSGNQQWNVSFDFRPGPLLQLEEERFFADGGREGRAVVTSAGPPIGVWFHAELVIDFQSNNVTMSMNEVKSTQPLSWATTYDTTNIKVGLHYIAHPSSQRTMRFDNVVVVLEP